jgi:hypothetical protein
MADDKGTGPGNDGSPGRKGGATGGERASDLARRALARDSHVKNRAEETRSWDTYRPKPKFEPFAPRTGATSVERARQSFNPAWLLVPAAGLLLGGLGIANMNENADLKAPADNVPAQAAPVTQTAAAAALTSAKAMADCKITFSKTTIDKPVSRLKNITTGTYLDPAAGMQFVVVNTTASNTGTAACRATTADQRGYTGSTTYTTGDVTAGDQLDRGRRMTKSIGVDKSIEGAYVFQIPTGKTVSSVKLRANGSDTWTTVNAD